MRNSCYSAKPDQKFRYRFLIRRSNYGFDWMHNILSLLELTLFCVIYEYMTGPDFTLNHHKLAILITVLILSQSRNKKSIRKFSFV